MATLNKRTYLDDLEHLAKRPRTTPRLREIQAVETLKRKCADDLDLLLKKQRTDSGIFIPCPALETADDARESVMPLEVEMPDESLTSSTAAETNERAIVLYKPPVQEAFGNNYIPRIQFDKRIVASGLMNDAELLRRCGTPIMHSLDSNNNLALIPWVDPSSAIITPGELEARQTSSETSKTEEDVDEMQTESEAMEEDIVANGSHQFQPNGGTTQGSTEPWKYYGPRQPELGSTM